MRPDPAEAEAQFVEALRHAAAGGGLPASPQAAREYVERLVTDAAAAAFELERRRLALKRQYRDALLVAGNDPELAGEARVLHDAERALQNELDELRALLGVVRRRFTIRTDD